MYNVILAKNGRERRILTNITEQEALEVLNKHIDKALQAYIPESVDTIGGLQYYATVSWYNESA